MFYKRLSAIGICLFITASCFFTCSGEIPVSADLVLLNGKIWTVDENNPEAEAVAIWRDRILSVGKTNTIKSLAGPNTVVIDLEGKLVLPGFIDNHTHFVRGGNWLTEVHLKDAKDEEEFGQRLAEKSKELPPGAWITGGTWDHDNWQGGNLPTAELIDKYVPDRPVFVTRYDGHMSVANSLALQMAGVSSRTNDPPGGVIVRKPGSREPEGVLKDAAQDIVQRIIPSQSKAEIKQAIEAGMEEARRVGVTSIQDMNLNPTAFTIYQELIENGTMTLRINGHIPLIQWKSLADLGIMKNMNNKNWIKIGGLKEYVDGSVGSSTALFFEPYVQDPSTRGIFMTQPEILKKNMLEADKAGLHLAIHAIGFRANSIILDIIEELIQENGPGDRRIRIEHAQHIHPKDFERFAKLGVIASVQPYHAIDDGRFIEKRIGYERSKTTYPFRQFLDNGVTMTFGSDWTVAPLDPIKGIDAAVTRRTTDGKNPEGWFPEQKITVEEAIRAYTITNAYAVFEEDIKGSITEGKLADMVVLSQDILSIPVNNIVDTEVLYTIVNGKIVFEKN
ncbi:amidohydrolase [candidate division KSB1 bacterium]|nr:amidohydrolase [candidate division KSB1 bacterium]